MEVEVDKNGKNGLWKEALESKYISWRSLDKKKNKKV